MGVATTSADRLRHHLRQPLARTPYLYDAAIALRASRRPQLARRDTTIVIEGFLRCGNTFSVAAFTVANGEHHHIASHLHAAAHVHRAVRLGLPTVVVIREPVDAVLSYMQRRPSLTLDSALRQYMGFYTSTWTLRERFITALFPVIIQDYGSVLRAVNERFGTSFAPFDHSPDNERAAFALVEEMNRRECDGEVVETHVARPSAARAARKEELMALLEAPGTAARLERAQKVHRQYERWVGDRSAR